ncbi:MAG TPA: FGGY-family carbohydrate kinase [Fimbriimonadaceae bacterium]|nr:FGGY-family carbohydrate kinase [Fimbriimonadaceae bacterium]
MSDFAGAVAVDLGASSARFAAGRIESGRIQFEIVEQKPHEPREQDGRLVWDFPFLLDFCRRAAAYAGNRFGVATIGIDTWGVDHGLIGEHGGLLQPVVAYRDRSHAAAFEALHRERSWLYAATAIQHQPFNTLYQLWARTQEDPTLPDRTRAVLVLPDLLGFFLTGREDYEFTEWSTSGLLGLDGGWSQRAFALTGFDPPPRPPGQPGELIGMVSERVQLARIAGHDTASAVCGLGLQREGQAFLNVGTWSLVGCLVSEPIASSEAEAANLTNERAADGRVRLLANIPGFYVVNRLHQELGVRIPVPQWLASAEFSADASVDLLQPEFFNPQSMVEAMSAGLPSSPANEAQWAGLALVSLAGSVKRQLQALERVAGRRFESIRAAGGGSASVAFCQTVADTCGLPVVAGPVEATVLGNLGVQFLAQGAVTSFAALGELVRASIDLKVYDPRGAGAPGAAEVR